MNLPFSKIFTLRFTVALILIVSSLVVNAQTQSQISNYYINGRVKSIKTDNNNNTFIGGSFTSIGIRATNIAQFNLSNGILDTNLFTTDGEVYAIIPIANGGWYVGGEFTVINGVQRNRLAKINIDGSVDGFNPNINGGTTPKVNAMALDYFGNLYVGGKFTKVGSDSIRGNFAKFNNNGDLASVVLYADWPINAICVDGNNNIYIGGEFTEINTIKRSRIACISQYGNILPFAPDINNTVNAICIGNNHEINVGGVFTKVGIENRYGFAQFNLNGLLTNIKPSINYGVNCIIVNKEGKINIGGGFTAVNDTILRNNFVQIDSLGNVTNYNPDFNLAVMSMALDTFDNLYAGGLFTQVNNITRNRFVVVDKFGDLKTQHPNFNHYVFAVAVNKFNNKLLIAGVFKAVGSRQQNRIAKFNSLGVLTDFNPGFNNDVNALVFDKNNNLIVGGNFTTVGGNIVRNRIAKFNVNGSLDTFNASFNSAVFALNLTNDNKLCVGGSFTIVDGLPKNRFVVFDSNLALLNINHNFNGSVLTIASNYKGDIYAGGSFTTINGLAKQRLVKFNGNFDLLDYNYSLNDSVFVIKSDSNNNIYVGGKFTLINNVINRAYFAKFSESDSIIPINLNINNTVNAIEFDHENNIYLGGRFILINSKFYNRFAKLDTGLSVYLSNAFFYNQVNAISFSKNGLVHVGGEFVEPTQFYAVLKGFCNLPIIVNQPVSHFSCYGKDVSFSLSTSGNQLSYQWKKNGENIGENQSILNLYKVNHVANAKYYCEVTNVCGTTYSDTVTLTVNPAANMSINGNTLTANTIGAFYQWFKCDTGISIIGGSTSRSFTASTSGSYGVIIILGSCRDTSVCEKITITAVEKLLKEEEVNIFPNPTHGNITVEIPQNCQLTLFENSGKKLTTLQILKGNNEINLSELSPGIYTLQIEAQQHVYYKKLVVN